MFAKDHITEIKLKKDHVSKDHITGTECSTDQT